MMRKNDMAYEGEDERYQIEGLDSHCRIVDTKEQRTLLVFSYDSASQTTLDGLVAVLNEMDRRVQEALSIGSYTWGRE
jgi:hypothetical protein